MSLLQLERLSQEAVESLKPSFNNLPETSHKDGAYRLRRYSVIELRTSFWNAEEGTEIERLEHGDFSQSEDLNKHQGGMSRSFEEIEAEALQSKGMKELTLLFKNINKFTDGQEVEIHQMRVVSRAYNKDPISPAPEGVHQDGFDKIAIVSINKSNIQGGAVKAYRDNDGEEIFSSPLRDGEVVNLDDKELWHWASEIELIDPTKDGYWDAFVLCVNIS